MQVDKEDRADLLVVQGPHQVGKLERQLIMGILSHNVKILFDVVTSKITA